MRVPRVFLGPHCRYTGNNEILITGAEAAHLLRVLRLGGGAGIDILDGKGNILRARLQHTERGTGGAGEVRATVYETGPAPGGEPPLRLTLVQGLARGEKMDLVVQKAVEIGVSRIVPVVCARTVVRLDPNGARRRQERWQKIAVEAAEQCGRPLVPSVDTVSPLGTALSLLSPHAAGLLLWERERSVGLKDICDGFLPPHEVFVFVGPEGGFTAEEVDQCAAAGVRAVSLGPRILRTETAGLVAATMVLYAWGDLGRTGSPAQAP